MSGAERPEITRLLQAWGSGDEDALSRLTSLLYKELHRMAHRHMKDEHANDTIQTTALVNEVYLRLVDVQNIDWRHRGQFFALSAQLMRRILVDAARARGSNKRGGSAVKVPFNEELVLPAEPERFVLALDDALKALEKTAPRQAKVVELRYFAGMTEEETAEVMQTSPRTIRRDWQFAKAWLMREINQPRIGQIE